MARVIGCLMLAVLFLFPSSSASADTGVLVGEKSAPPVENGPDVRTFQDFAAAARRFEKHLFVGQDGLLHVNAQTGAEIGISEAWYQVFETAMEETNRQLRRGALDVTDVRLVDGTHNVFGREVVSGLTPQSHVQCAGRSGVAITWMGPRYYFDDCQTHFIKEALTSGVGLATLCVPAYPLPCTVAAGLVTIGVGNIGALDERGGHHGIYVQFGWSMRPLYVWHQ